MGKNPKKKTHQKRKTSQRDSDRDRYDWILDGNKYLDSESPQNEDDQAKELSGTNIWSCGDTFPYSCNIEDNEYNNETIKFALMGKSERNLMNIE